MFIVVFFTLIAIILTHLDSRGYIKNGMFFGFVLVTTLGCVHYNYGNDYMAYFDMYKELVSMPLRWDYLIDNTYNHEPGWVLLNHFFSHLGGFFVMVAVLNIVQNTIFFYFIKENVQKRYWTVSMAIYLMSGSLYILNFSMMRQAIAIALFVFSWNYIKRKKFWPSLLILFVASTFHYSAQILIPFMLLPFITLRGRGKVIAVIYVGIMIALFISTSLLADVFETVIQIEKLRSVQNLEYQIIEDNGTLTYGWGVVVNMIPFFISMWALFTNEKKIDNDKKMLIMISMVSFLILPFGKILQIIGRYGMYFTAYSVASIPFIYSLLPNKMLHRLLLGIYIFMLLFEYYEFFNSDIWAKDYSTFHTIFEVL